MNDALQIFYYILNKFWEFVFGAYFFDGVSFGMLLVVGSIFAILLRYAIAIPKANVKFNQRHESKGDQRENNGQN